MPKLRIVVGHGKAQRTYSVTVPKRLVPKFKLQQGIEGIFSTGDFEPPYFGPLLMRKEWRELYGLLETILSDAIMEPPGKAYIIQNIGKIIKILGLEEI
jgi:hypothetical protein